MEKTTVKSIKARFTEPMQPLREKINLLDYLDAVVESPYSLVNGAHQGVSAAMVNVVADELEMPQDELAKLLNISPKTLRKYLSEDKLLDVSASELILKLHAMHQVGIDVFGNVKDLRRWLAAPAFGFEGKIPLSLLKTSQGIELVTAELYRIVYGDFS